MTKPDEAVTFTLPSGARVTASEGVARRLGWQPTPAPAKADEAPKPRRRRKPATK